MKNKRKMKNIVNSSIAVIVITIALIMTGCSKQTSETVRTGTNENIAASNKGARLVVDKSATKVEWNGKKFTGEHNGTVDIKGGELFVENGSLAGGKFEIDLTTIKNLDIKDTASSSKLTKHLKSEDFFSAEKHPVAVFEISSIEPISDDKGNNYKISGKMTIKGITKDISFPAKVNVAGNQVTANAEIILDRTIWDIRFGSKKFFENLTDNFIYDDFTINLNLVANQN